MGKLRLRKASFWTSLLLLLLGSCALGADFHPPRARRISSKIGVSTREAANTPYTACTGELPDVVSTLTGYKLTDVILSEGQYRVSKPPNDGESGSRLSAGVTDLLRTLEGRPNAACYKEERKVVLLPYWRQDFNTYHNLIFYTRQYVQSMVAAWGSALLKAQQEPIFYGLYSKDEEAYLTAPDNAKAYKSLEVFFSGAYTEEAQRHNRSCVSLQNAVLVPKMHFYSAMYDTQRGEAQAIEKETYSVMREMYVQKFASSKANSKSAAENSTVQILFLGRPSNDWRHIINEAELLSAVQEYANSTKGVDVAVHHDFEASTFANQVALMASSDVLIGPHGAGLTNVLFMKPQSVLIELLPNGWSDPCYRNLAIFSGKTYMFWQQANSSLSEHEMMKGGKMVKLGRHGNFHADVGEVMCLLRSAVNIVSMVGSRWWPDCPGHEFLGYKRAAPIKCPKLWVRDEGVLGDTPMDRLYRLA